ARLRERPAKIVGRRRRVDRADRGAESIGEFVDRGDADVEAQALDVVFDLGEHAVRGPADALGRVAECRRRLRTLRPDDALDLADEAPQALRLLEGAL